MIEGIKPDEKMTALWDLNNLRDLTGNGHDLASFLNGKEQSIFNESASGGASLTVTDAFNVGTFTINAWYRPDPNNTTYSNIYSHFQAVRTGRPPFYRFIYYGIQFIVDTYGNSVSATIGDGTATTAQAYAELLGNMNKLSMLTLTYNDLAGVAYIYINGKKAGTNITPVVTPSWTHMSSTIGAGKEIDNVAFYSNYFMQEQEVALLFNQFNV